MNNTETKRYKRLCSNINKVLSKGALYEWDMGCAIEKLYESDLWRQALSVHGTPYTSFQRFMRSEFNVIDRDVYRYRRLTNTFTREQVRGWNVRQLSLIANVKNPLRRQKFFKMATKHVFSKVEAEIRKLPATELFFPHKTEETVVSNTSTWALTDIKHILDEYKDSYIRLDVARGKYRVSLAQGQRILITGTHSRLTRAVGDLKTKLERQRHRTLKVA